MPSAIIIAGAGLGMAITPELLESIDSFETLASKLFHDELGWPVSKWEVFASVPKLYGLHPENDIPGVVKLAAVQKIEDLDWGIFLVDFGENPLKRGDLRRILNKVAEKARAQHDNPTWPHDNILFICRSEGNNWTFAYFSGDKPATAKLRRFGWTDPQEARTAIENLRKLEWGKDWSKAWDVKSLTKYFFTKISDLFFDAMEAVKKPIPDENERRLFIQTLFNRLIFLRFVEKKGWLKFNGRDDYLRALWEAGKDGANPFWPTRLNALFQAVNHKESEKAHVVAKPLVGDVVYLNGGLFDDDPRFVDPKINIPETIFEKLLGTDGLFYRYNFTVEESTPLDQQVAVDPEILGKVFEQLTISGKRHDTGSYYTPREIVQFMCREALVGYLGSKGISEDKARALVYDHETAALTNDEGNAAFNALKTIKVVDPACGSGAYLLGILQELYALFELLRRDDRRFSDDPAKEAHERKLHIIENNLYGVDIQEFATNTAMLRLWLTLLVEDTGETPQPLPNLEYKIETGDSLLGPDPSEPIDWSKVQRGLDFEGVHETVEQLRKLRATYQDAHGPAKAEVKKQFEAKLAELREKVTGSPKKDPAKFDWRVEFFDVFLEDPAQRQPGFDAVLANPPYVRHELITAIKPALKSVFGGFYCGTADLYTYFYARAHQLLRPGGILAFISSNKWFRAAYGANLRKLMADETDVRSITDFGGLPIFETAATFPMIFVSQKAGRKTSHQGSVAVQQGSVAVQQGSPVVNPLFTQVKSLDPPYPDVRALIAESGFALPPNALNGAEWRLVDAETAARMRRMEQSGVPLGEYVKGNIYRGILTGFNEAFVIDGAKRAALIAEDPKSAEIIKPLAVGDDVRKWRIRKRDVWLIFTRRGVDLDRYPAIKRHLSQWRKQLEPRPRDWDTKKQGEWPGRKPGSYKWFEIQDDIAYYAEFDKPKIVYSEISKEPRFTLDNEGTYLSNTAYLIGSAEQFLLAVLNSGSAWSYLATTASVLGDEEAGGRIRVIRQFAERIPIPRASAADRAAIEALVQQILDLKAADPDADVSELEAEIDTIVERLYFGGVPAPSRGTLFTQVKSLDPPYPDVKALIEQGGFKLPPGAINGAEWRLVDAETAARMKRMEERGVPLGEYVKGKIYYGIKTGFNEAFVIDGAKRAALIAEDPKSAEIIKPLAVGDDVRKWRIRKRDVWLIFTRRGVDLDRYPAIKRHLSQWRKQLEPRPRNWDVKKQGEWPGRKPGSYKWFEIQDDIAYYAEFDKPKIAMPDICKESRFALAAAGVHVEATATIIATAEPFLLGLLNSQSVWQFFMDKCAVLGDATIGGCIRLKLFYVRHLPIPRASAADRAAIEALVQQILDLKAADPDADVSELEAEIDKRVEFLYFHQDEAPTYDA